MSNINFNTAVLTSKYVVSNLSPIVYATLHEDGVWEFWSKETIAENEVMVVSLKQILDVDKSIDEILTMPAGFYATRNKKEDKWEINSKN